MAGTQTAPSTTRIDQAAAVTHIQFDKNTVDIPDTEAQSLDRLASSLANIQGQIELRIFGHSDNDGSRRHNLQLSEERASRVKDYLKSRLNNPRFSFSSRGLGSSSPLPGLTAEAAENRRASIHVSFSSTAIAPK